MHDERAKAREEAEEALAPHPQEVLVLGASLAALYARAGGAAMYVSALTALDIDKVVVFVLKSKSCWQENKGIYLKY